MKTKRPKKKKWYISRLNKYRSLISCEGEVVRSISSRDIHHGLIYQYVPVKNPAKVCTGCVAENNHALCISLPDCGADRNNIIWKRVHFKPMGVLVGDKVLFTKAEIKEWEEKQRCEWELA